MMTAYAEELADRADKLEERFRSLVADATLNPRSVRDENAFVRAPFFAQERWKHVRYDLPNGRDINLETEMMLRDFEKLTDEMDAESERLSLTLQQENFETLDQLETRRHQLAQTFGDVPDDVRTLLEHATRRNYMREGIDMSLANMRACHGPVGDVMSSIIANYLTVKQYDTAKHRGANRYTLSKNEGMECTYRHANCL